MTESLKSLGQKYRCVEKQPCFYWPECSDEIKSKEFVCSKHISETCCYKNCRQRPLIEETLPCCEKHIAQFLVTMRNRFSKFTKDYKAIQKQNEQLFEEKGNLSKRVQQQQTKIWQQKAEIMTLNNDEQRQTDIKHLKDEIKILKNEKDVLESKTEELSGRLYKANIQLVKEAELRLNINKALGGTNDKNLDNVEKMLKKRKRTLTKNNFDSKKKKKTM